MKQVKFVVKEKLQKHKNIIKVIKSKYELI